MEWPLPLDIRLQMLALLYSFSIHEAREFRTMMRNSPVLADFLLQLVEHARGEKLAQRHVQPVA